ncbi:MAG TPA: DNA ligase D, partial [Bacteroidia bacterium]|nr:DNA ligase D [Bacteroidia bacterium]
MLAEIGDKPFDHASWIFETKYDGYRALANIENGKVDLYSRNLNSFNSNYPEIARELSKIRHTAILDGEVVVEDEQGRSGFQLLQNRDSGAGRLKYYVFDLLHLNGHELFQVPLIKRKELLKTLLSQFKLKNIIYSEHIEEKGTALYQKCSERNFEGIIAKNARSPYRPASRTKEWLKIKINQQQEAVIVGLTSPRGSRSHFGSLVLAVRDGKTWTYVGNCGTGFSEKMLRQLYEMAKPYFTPESPFSVPVRAGDGIQWLKPALVCEVKFSEWTKDGSMRHPVFRGLRKDKKPVNVVREVSHVHVTRSGKAVEEGVESETPVRKRKEIKVRQRATQRKKVKISAPSGKKTENIFDLKVGRVTLHLTNQHKIYWPYEKITKGELVAYYGAIAPLMLPYLKDRPQSLNRFPNGIKGSSFFQKDIDRSKVPQWLKTEKVYSESNKAYIDYLICNDKATLMYMANLGCIEINPWNSRIKKPEYPDWVVIDLDPESIAFVEVVRTALKVKEVLDELQLDGYCKTSGASGLHIYVPLGAKYDYDIAKRFAELIAHFVHMRLPDTTSLLRSPAKRKHKVYIDFLQNRRGQTLAAPYSVRPKHDATVSTPLLWEEVNESLDPKMFTMKNIFARVQKIGDIWAPVIGKGEDITQVVKRMKT